MPSYTPPLRDMQFVMHEVLHVTDELKACARHADVDADTINAVLEEAGKFAAEVAFPLNISGDQEGCTLDPADADLVAVISSGDTAVWDSAVCRSALLEDPVSLSPGWSTSVATSWSGRGSGPACSAKEGWANDGSSAQLTEGSKPGGAMSVWCPSSCGGSDMPRAATLRSRSRSRW